MFRAEGQVSVQYGRRRLFIEQVRQLAGWFKDYVQELRMEMRRVTWPSRKQVQATTGVVIVTVFAFAAYFFVVDPKLSAQSRKLFNIFSK